MSFNATPAVDEILRTKQVAAWVGVEDSTLRVWRFQGTGPKWFKIGPRLVGYKRSDVEAWLEAQYEEAGK